MKMLTVLMYSLIVAAPLAVSQVQLFYCPTCPH